MNLLSLSERDGDTVIKGTNGPPVLEGSNQNTLLGVRPEHVKLSDGAGVPVTVQEVEHHGAESIIGCRVGDQRVLLRTEGWSSVNAGSETCIRWHPKDVHIFDAESGGRMNGAVKPVDVGGM